jgi:sulfate transport system substrate-binding protein
MAQLHYRPRDIEALEKYRTELPPIPFFTIDETFGGWVNAHKAFFADGALFDQIYCARGFCRAESRPAV